MFSRRANLSRFCWKSWKTCASFLFASRQREDALSEKQKPAQEIVKKAAHFLKHPEAATLADIKSMAARLMDDQRNDATPHKVAAIKPKAKIAAAPAPVAAPVPAAKAVKKSKVAA
jgi:uncharacterized protein YnzC (UPF0291/DUF896 family)